MEKNERINIVNAVLATLDRGYMLTYQEGKGFYFSWQDWKGKTITKRWNAAPNFYPSFHRAMACGGTQTIAITQLVRWCQGKTVLPQSSWKYWGSKNVMLWRDTEKRDAAIALLENSDYPKNPICVFCGKDLSGCRWDWFHAPKQGVACRDAFKGVCNHQQENNHEKNI